MTASLDFSQTCAIVRTEGFSDSARYVNDQAKLIQDRMRRLMSLNQGRYAVQQALEQELDDCAEKGWDGYSAEPVSNQTYRYAYQFVEALPDGLPMPTVSADADGHLQLEWYKTPSRLLTLAVSPEGELFYSGMFDGARSRGSETLLGEIPRPIISLIRRVYGW